MELLKKTFDGFKSCQNHNIELRHLTDLQKIKIYIYIYNNRNHNNRYYNIKYESDFAIIIIISYCFINSTIILLYFIIFHKIHEMLKFAIVFISRY